MMFFITSGPFLEENDDSRRAVKPIVVKDQDYDGQTQRTGQAMVSSTAVQAELKTVSDSVEDITNTIPTSNTSTPLGIDNCYKKFLKYHKLPQIQKPVTLIQFIQHLHQNSFFNLI